MSASPISAIGQPLKDHILVVDDIPDNSFLLQILLQDEGYQVEVAGSGREALAKIAVTPPDLILLDVMMPGMNGYEVARHIRQDRALPFIPIVLVTGHDQLSDEAHRVGANGLIRKPIDFDQLLRQVQALLPFRQQQTAGVQTVGV